ncbi:unnamed protein product [Umbelopsis ramanniana]
MAYYFRSSVEVYMFGVPSRRCYTARFARIFALSGTKYGVLMRSGSRCKVIPNVFRACTSQPQFTAPKLFTEDYLADLFVSKVWTLRSSLPFGVIRSFPLHLGQYLRK